MHSTLTLVSLTRRNLWHSCSDGQNEAPHPSKKEDDHIPIAQINWEHVHDVNKKLSHCLTSTSRIMTFLKRHSLKLPDQDGAVYYENFSFYFAMSLSAAPLTNAKRVREWNGQNSVWVFFGSTLSSLTLDVNSRSFRRSSYRSKIAKIMKHPYVWTEYIYHVGS